MDFNCYVCSKKGNFRENNEDNLYVNGTYLEVNHTDRSFEYKCKTESAAVFGVFDGLGGEEKGEEASFRAAEALDKAENMEDYFNIANNSVCSIEKSDKSKQIGSTAAIVSISREGFIAANIGDSRIYYIRDNNISMLSVDHTMVETMIASGVITREDAEKNPYKNCLTQCLGMSEEEMIITPYISKMYDYKKGDIFVICSDGLSGVLSAEEILKIIRENESSVNIAEILTDKAYENGTRDNTTVIVIYVKSNGLGGVINEFIKKLNLNFVL